MPTFLSTRLSYHHVKELIIGEVKNYTRESDNVEFQSLEITLRGEGGRSHIVNIGIYNEVKDGGIKVIGNIDDIISIESINPEPFE